MTDKIHDRSSQFQLCYAKQHNAGVSDMIRNTLITILLCSSTTIIYAKDKINNEWLNIDRLMLSKSKNLLTTDLKSMKEITNYNYYQTDQNENKNLGLNYKIIHLLKPAGYSSINLSAVIDHDQNIIMYEVRISSDELVWNKLLKEYEFSAIKNVHITKSGLSYTKRNDQLFADFTNTFMNYFGRTSTVTVPETVKDEYVFLTNPLSDYDYGYKCYFSGSKPEAKLAIEKIVKYGNTKIIEQILTASNPEGRFYAIEALFTGNIDLIKSKNRYSDILEKIANLKIPVSKCSGCLVYNEEIKDVESISKIINPGN